MSVDAVAIDKALHEDPPILQGSEKVEMAFQGHRDITLFTTKRLVTIDKKGLFGKKVCVYGLLSLNQVFFLGALMFSSIALRSSVATVQVEYFSIPWEKVKDENQ